MKADECIMVEQLLEFIASTGIWVVQHVNVFSKSTTIMLSILLLLEQICLGALNCILSPLTAILYDELLLEHRL